MDLDLLGWLALGAGWLIAAVIADALPATDDPARLRRRVTGLLTLVVVGLVGTTAMIGWGIADVADAVAARAVAVLAVGPALAVAVLAVPRLRRLRAGSAAFRTAPAAPTPPSLRADAAHPLLALPMQVAAAALLPVGMQTAGGDAVLGAETAGLVSTAAVLLLVATGVRHALRHSRLAERAVTGRVRWSPIRAGSYPR
ncbi:hypothetical protein [Micromonospora sp. LOL_023]|uniref:hypothetical protein n=1 Tax=Micromonospora sp. LOL_023 TaxID=3345418 RepID=UPI003A89B9EC